jgi:ArsR family transcriptional regulator, arsenate/arsenite/antimonite-responsive transcriptional repressor
MHIWKAEMAKGDSTGDLSPRMVVVLKSLAHSKRLELVQRLIACGRPCGVTELNECCPVDFSVVSRHLAILRDAGILRAEKKGREVYYSVISSVAHRLRRLADAMEGKGKL